MVNRKEKFMRGHALYFYMLKDDLIESFKRVEEKLGGLQYVIHTIYKEAKFEIFDSIEKITDIGLITPIETHYYIALKNEEFSMRKVELLSGGYSYHIEDKQGFLQFFPSGIFENSNCIKRGEINTVAETDSRLMLFKELKKSILKNSMKINRGISTYVGKSIIENKEKYRIPYGSPASPPEDDFDISDMVWQEKRRKKKD